MEDMLTILAMWRGGNVLGSMHLVVKIGVKPLCLGCLPFFSLSAAIERSTIDDARDSHAGHSTTRCSAMRCAACTVPTRVSANVV